jgi:hypothetical protein
MFIGKRQEGKGKNKKKNKKGMSFRIGLKAR